MSPVSIILANSDKTRWIVDAARNALRSADVIFCDQSVPTHWLQAVGSKARRVVVETTYESQDQARTAIVSACRGGRRVVRLHWQASWRDAVVLRDMRYLGDRKIEVDFVPGIEPGADSWSTWTQQRPLFGKRIVVLRMRGQASATADLLQTRGAQPWVVPTIVLGPCPDPNRFAHVLKNLSFYDFVAFTSTNGVQRTFEVLDELGLDARAFGSCKVAAIGSVTARRLTKLGIKPDVVAKTFVGEALASEILSSLGSGVGKKVLIVRALEARPALPEILREKGIVVDVVPAYETLCPPRQELAPLVSALKGGGVDAVLLTASSTVNNLCTALGDGYAELLSGTVLASIGPITTEKAKDLGLEVAVQAKTFTMTGVMEALEEHWSK